MGTLAPVDATPGPAFVEALLRAWDAGDAVLPIDPRLPRPAVERLLVACRADEPVEDGDALVVATSGTTGEPKGVVLTHDAVRASALATSARLGVDPSTDSWLSILPLAHVGGLSVVLRALVTGTPLVWDGRAPRSDGRSGRATLVSMVATQLRRTDVSSFRWVVLGGAAPPPDLPPNVVTTYGMTETGSGVVYDGVPLDGVSVRVVDGELQVRGPMLLRCYRDGTDPKDADGWLPTGDGGRVDADGRVHVDGRLADVINTGGEKVWPVAVEAVLKRHAGVEDCAVVGRPDPEWGQKVVAYVVGRLSLDEARDVVKAELPAYCAPKEVVVVDDLPRTPLGKVQKRFLEH